MPLDLEEEGKLWIMDTSYLSFKKKKRSTDLGGCIISFFRSFFFLLNTKEDE